MRGPWCLILMINLFGAVTLSLDAVLLVLNPILCVIVLKDGAIRRW